LLKIPLLLLSYVYGALIRGLTLFYSFRPHKLNCKVISIGNITVGGTGKTSLVEFVARFLRDKGHRVAILSRGYKKLSGSMGDEPFMLLKNLEDIPVIVDKDRVRAAVRAVAEYGADTVILDDGMQQWRIKKDLEIITVSAAQWFGNRHMMPRGILREPLSSLKRADIFVLTKTNLAGGINDIKASLNKFNSRAPVIESVHEAVGFYDKNRPDELLSLSPLQGKNVALFSGIADPYSFTDLVNSLGIKVGLDLRFDDHHNYSVEDLSGIIGKCSEKKLGIIITTEKDAARLSEEKLELFKGYQVLVLRIALKITKNEKQLIAGLLGLYSL
jgi:tetraacyldisaccharide 4'-kinase